MSVRVRLYPPILPPLHPLPHLPSLWEHGTRLTPTPKPLFFQLHPSSRLILLFIPSIHPSILSTPSHPSIHPSILLRYIVIHRVHTPRLNDTSKDLYELQRTRHASRITAETSTAALSTNPPSPPDPHFAPHSPIPLSSTLPAHSSPPLSDFDPIDTSLHDSLNVRARPC